LIVDRTKLFSDLYLVKLLDISTKSFFPRAFGCNEIISSLC